MMTTFSSKQSQHVLALCTCLALMAIACGGDTPYEPLKGEKPPHARVVGGTVRDTGKNAVADAVVALEPAHDGVSATAKWMLEHPDATSESVPGRRVTVTGASGRYTFDDVTAGEYILQVLAEDHLGASRRFTVPAVLEDTIIVDVNLTPTGDFTGNVLLEFAINHANTVVYLEGTSYVAVTDPAAGYTISDVPVGVYTVRATHPGYLDDTEAGTITTAGEVVVLSDMTLPIDKNLHPTATASAIAGCELNPVVLSGTGSDMDGTIALYGWDFEDDGTVDYTSTTSASTNHTYSSGAHRAKLTVIDDKGAIGLAVVTFATAPAETVFVSTTGSNANPGTRNFPKLTINAGVQAAVPDTTGLCPATVIVAAGTYNESSRASSRTCECSADMTRRHGRGPAVTRS
jgi:hypothetical protein